MNTALGQDLKVSDSLIQRALERVANFNRFREEGLICCDGDFFPSVHYAPITLYDETNEDELSPDYNHTLDVKLDNDAHIPFFKKECSFCHYTRMVCNKQA